MENTDSITLSLELNKNHKNKRGQHSVRLFVFNSITKDKCYIKTPFKLLKADFEGAWLKKNSKAKFRNLRMEMLKFLDSVDSCILELGRFDKDEFKSVFYGNGPQKKDLKYYYDKKITDFTESGGLGTADQYQCSYKFIKKYNNDKVPEFNQITPKWLIKFDKHCTDKGLLTTSSIGMYLRCLKSIFNLAIHEGAVSNDKYPFGKFGYIIPKGENIKKALIKEQVQKLYESKSATPYQKMSKDFWFFSYLSYGLNLKDILMIKNKDLEEGFFYFERKKTLHTVKTRTPIKVYLTDFTKEVIRQYGDYNPDKPQDYVFDILNIDMNDMEKRKRKKNFNRKINQHFLKFANSIGIQENVSFSWARHSFATIAILSGVRFEVVSKRLTHTSVETTMLYFKGFEEETFQEINDKILDFSKKTDANDSSNLTKHLL
jgi:site-specific recombinase XerD